MAANKQSYKNAHDETTGAFESEAAFNCWVKTTQKSLVRFCRQFVNDWNEADDMAQEAYIRAWQKQSSFRGKSSLITWQMAIARRVCLDYLRKTKKMTTVQLNEHDTALANDIDTTIDVQRALQKLSEDDRVVLYLRTGEELSFDDIAQILALTAAACRKRYERAKSRFEAIYNNTKPVKETKEE